ncbi:capsular biosynthesis protein [Myxosarcina sp. GI1]|uniref:capsular biosynthesis protein n=1 Tax=Myxosarcina sp. GI1 TaxID=1541065 RepID=UPI00068A5D54
MFSKEIQPQNFPERVVWYSMTWTYFSFLLGATYVVGSVVAWILFFYLLLKLWLQDEYTSEAERITIPWITWVWIIGMLMMEVALIFGHLDYNLPTSQIIKSSIGWAKGWALIALYPLAGCLNIRPQIIYRAACVICFHTLVISPLLILAPILGLPETLYVSPLKAVGAGLGPIFFDVSLYAVDFDGQIRQRLFTPWGPALGFVANVYFTLAVREKDKKWRWYGIIGAIYLSQICKSRLAQVCILSTPIFIFVLSRLIRPYMLMLMGGASVAVGILATNIMNAIAAFWKNFKAQRAASSRVRAALKEIAFYRAETEAPIWGHGILQMGPHVVEFMPIGSHHTWAGLAFVKGAVGFYSLAIPMFVGFLFLLVKAQNNKDAGTALAILFILFLYTFGENLEILAYLYWPGLIMIGIGFRKSKTEQSSNSIVSESA